MKLSDVVYWSAYRNAGRFANIERFVDHVVSTADIDDSANAGQLINELRAFSLSLKSESEHISSQAAAFQRLVGADIERLLSGSDEITDEMGDVERSLAEGFNVVSARLASLGLEISDVPLRIVDRFPAPFDRFDWSAFAPDREDEEQFDIERGIYFRRDRLRPLYSEALLAHEIVHTIPGKIDPEIYAMGLEEGLAEVVGTCYGALGFMPPDVLRNIVVYGRHGCDRPKLWSVYMDHTRQAYSLFNNYGLEGIADLLKRGRRAIHDAEAAILAGSVDSLDLPKGCYDKDTERLLALVACGYIPSHVFSPLECLLVLEVRAGVSLTEVCQRAQVDARVGIPLLEELGARSALFVQSGDRVSYSNVEHYLEIEASTGLTILRYLPLLSN